MTCNELRCLMMESLMYIWYILLAICGFILLTAFVFLTYAKLLKKRHYLFSLFLFSYPILLGVIGKLLLIHGRKLNQEDLNHRLAAGMDTHIFSIDAGVPFTFWGYLLWIAIIPISIIVLILILTRLISFYTQKTPY